MTYESNLKDWNDEWRAVDSIEESASPVGKWLRKQRLEKVTSILSKLDRNLSIIDMGCGAGTTLKIIRELGFKNSVGIDFSPMAIERCEQHGFVRGVDVFEMDASKTSFKDNEFDIMFEEGLWEHFEDPMPFINEAARIAKKYMLLIQPNHYSFFGAILHWLWMVIGSGGVIEYSFRMKYFVESLDIHGFDFIELERDVLDAQWVMLFKRREPGNE